MRVHIAIKELAVERLEPAHNEIGLFLSAFVNGNSTETDYLGNILANLTKLRLILTKPLIGRNWRRSRLLVF